ncbi:hypothetical protein [Paenibacillus sp. 1P03SA]|uniref:hypothetical protein n=1 Tax=Paenibacillus sp. 1P03SA TaxID=3132294 RepID=UPI0039A23CF0
MNAQLLVCDQITNNASLGGHALGTVLNQVSIPALPYVVELHVLIKLFDLPRHEFVDTALIITNSSGEIIDRTPATVLRNYRAEDQVPGVDQDLSLNLIVTDPGIIYIRCMVNGEEAAWYPLTIRLQECKVS